MLKNRNILILALVLVVLGGISLLQKAGHKKDTNRSATVTVIEETFTPDQLDRITLGLGQEEVVVDLVSTPAGWVLASNWDAPANLARIETLLRNAGGLTGESRSASESVLADYSLSSEMAVKIRAYDKQGALALAVDVGGQPERFPGNFVRRPDSHEVYLSQINLLAQLGLYNGPERPDYKHFLELQAVQEDNLAVDRVILNDGGQMLEMVKEFAVVPPAAVADSAGEASLPTEDAPAELDRTTWEWKLVTPRSAALAKTKADGVLNSLAKIRATDVDDPQGDLEAYGLAVPTRTATITREDGSNLTLEFGSTREAEEGGQAGVWMMVRGLPRIWVVTEYTVKNIFKSVEDLLPDQD